MAKEQLKSKHVLGRVLATELTAKEIAAVSGAAKADPLPQGSGFCSGFVFDTTENEDNSC